MLCWRASARTTKEREGHAVTLAGVVLGTILVISEIYQFIYAVPTYEVSVPFPAAVVCLLPAPSNQCKKTKFILTDSSQDGSSLLSSASTAKGIAAWMP